jgi:hypothetical protein
MRSLLRMQTLSCRASWLLALFAACFAVGVGQSSVSAGLVVNGSFEMPAGTGDGAVYSTDPAFSLPGWTYPTGPNRFFLEFGQPVGRPRYFDGRQAVCLNGDGVPVSLSQTLDTVIGQQYTLSFALGEEQTTRPSPASVLVDFGTLTQAFDLGSTVGYAVFDVSYTATSTSTLLRFSDNTPNTQGIAHSPFLDAISVNAAPSSVPEPASLILLSTGGLGLLVLGRRRIQGHTPTRRT